MESVSCVVALRLLFMKKSFTLFEVLISLVIFSVLLLSLLRLNHKEDHLKTYYELQAIENKYIESGVISSSERIKLRN